MQSLYLEKMTLPEIYERAEALRELQRECRLCSQECLAHRSEGETGKCNSPAELRVSSIGPHYGEEPPLVGSHGSGTIFLTGCNLCCTFCQNYDISQMNQGEALSTQELADSMLALQMRGCHNVNFVTPTHYTPQIVEALALAVEKGLEVPLVYNCGGYESVEALRLLDGIIDIYMPDMKYADDTIAARLSDAPRYREAVFAAVKEMHRQVGDLKVSRRGIAQRGLLIRRLVMPNGYAGSREIIDFIVRELGTETYINIMGQYRPAWKAHHERGIDRRTSEEEWQEAVDYARRRGLHRGLPGEE